MSTRVVVLGAHPRHGYSMHRYTDLLESAYREAGFSPKVLRPTNFLSRRVRSAALAKVLEYVETLVLFPLVAASQTRRADLVHLADHGDAIWILHPMFHSRVVVTCHDLTAVRAARGEVTQFRPGVSGQIQQRLILAGLRRARVVVSVSEATRVEAARLLPRVRTGLLLNPVAVGLARAWDGAESTSASPSCQRDPKYVLSVGSSAWYKNRADALRIWVLLRGLVPGLRLKVVGDELTASEVDGADLTSGWSALAADVDLEAGVDDARLRTLYREAELLIQTSTHEGFGWPVVEANANGTLVVCFDLAVFREVGPHNFFLTAADDGGAILAAWNNRHSSDRIAAAEAHVTINYSWDRFVRAIAGLVENETTGLGLGESR